MKNWIAPLATAAFVSLSGCASIGPVPVELQESASKTGVIVNFVRIKGTSTDEADVSLWDGTHFIGSLPPGRVVQYPMEPGKHLLMGVSGNWAYASGEFVAGKQYVVKANVAPGFGKNTLVLTAIKANDPRLVTWLKELRPMAPVSSQAPQGDSPKRAQALEAMKAGEDGSKVADDAKIGADHALDQLPESQNRQQSLTNF